MEARREQTCKEGNSDLHKHKHESKRFTTPFHNFIMHQKFETYQRLLKIRRISLHFAPVRIK